MASVARSAANERAIQLDVGRIFKPLLFAMLADLQAHVPVAIELYGGSALEQRGIYTNIRSPDVDVYFAPTTNIGPLLSDGGILSVPYRPFIQTLFAYIRTRFMELCGQIDWLESHIDTKRKYISDKEGFEPPIGDSEEFFPNDMKLRQIMYLCENRIRLYVLESRPYSGKTPLQIRASVRFHGMTFSVLDMSLKSLESLRGNRFQKVNLAIEDGKAAFHTVSNVRIANLRGLFDDLHVAITNELVQYRATSVNSRKEKLQQKIVTHLGRLKDIVLRDISLLSAYKALLDANVDLPFVRAFQVIPVGTGALVPLTANMPLYNLNGRLVRAPRTRRSKRRNRRRTRRH